MTAKQLGKRLLQIAVVAAGITFLTFLITYLAPGDPVRTMYAAAGIMPSEEIIQQTREAMGLNRPVLAQYFDWLQIPASLMRTTSLYPRCCWTGSGPR